MTELEELRAIVGRVRALCDEARASYQPHDITPWVAVTDLDAALGVGDRLAATEHDKAQPCADCGHTDRQHNFDGGTECVGGIPYFEGSGREKICTCPRFRPAASDPVEPTEQGWADVERTLCANCGHARFAHAPGTDYTACLTSSETPNLPGEWFCPCEKFKASPVGAVGDTEEPQR